MSDKEHLPWFSPDDSLEACELLEEIARLLQQLSEFSPLRKELRFQMADRARACADFLSRVNRPVLERSVVLAIEAAAEHRGVSSGKVLSEAIEQWLSRLNRA